MRTLRLAAIGWIVPGGAYLMTRRYGQFAVFAAAVTLTFGLGLGLQGGTRWPEPAELAGLDGFASLAFRAGALAKMLAGGPYLIASLFGGSGSFLDSRVHEYGSSLLMMAGVSNVLAISTALDRRPETTR